MLLVPTTPMTRGDPASVVTTTGLGFLFNQGSMRCTLVQVRRCLTWTTPRRPGDVGFALTIAMTIRP